MEDLLEKYKALEIQKRLLICLLVGLVYPAYTYWIDEEIISSDLESAIAEEQSSTARLNRAKKTAQQLPKLEQEVGKIDEGLKEAQRYLPDEIKFEDILRRFGTFEQELDIKIHKFDPMPKQSVAGVSFYSEVPLRMEIKAEFSLIMVFLDKIVHQDDLVHLRYIKLIPENKPIKTSSDERDKLQIPKTIVKAEVDLVFFKREG